MGNHFLRRAGGPGVMEHPQNLEKGVLCVPLKLDPQFTTDASDFMWGAQIEGAFLQEKWSTEDYQTHINHKELFAVLSPSSGGGKSSGGKPFWMNNLTAVSYVSKQDGLVYCL